MHIVPRGNVRLSLALAILVTIVMSWVLSGGIANYFNYINFKSLRQEMLKRPDLYPQPMPKPRFGIIEFFTGRPPFENKPQFSKEPHKKPPEGPPMDMPFKGPHRHSPMVYELRWIILRLTVAFALAGLAGAWLGRRFTKPLTQLAKGADAFTSGNFDHRIPSEGNNEFAAVASAMNKMAEQVSDQITRLENDAKRRRQFLADIAHEFRSPVTTLRTMAGALKDGVADDPERKERAISSLVRTSDRLLRLVQDLMELAKLDLDDFPLNVRQVDLKELAESVIHAHDNEAAAAGIILHPLITSGSVKAYVDPDRIFQILDNIIENAISYAGKGAEVRVTLEDNNPVTIKVSDTGKGIKSADIPYIFDPFYRADAARTPGDCHSGLGLSIACRLVEAHGGQLNVSSEEGKGTTVTISIPKR